MIWKEVQDFKPWQVTGVHWSKFISQKAFFLDFVFQNCLHEVTERLSKGSDFIFECKQQINEGFLQIISQISIMVQFRFYMKQLGLPLHVDNEQEQEDAEKEAGCGIEKKHRQFNCCENRGKLRCGRRCGHVRAQRSNNDKSETIPAVGALGSTEDVSWDADSRENAFEETLKKGIEMNQLLRGGANRFQILSEEELSDIPEEEHSEETDAETSGHQEGEASVDSGKRSFYKDFFNKKVELRGGAGGSSTSQNKKLTEAVDALKTAVKAFAEEEQQGNGIAEVIADTSKAVLEWGKSMPTRHALQKQLREFHAKLEEGQKAKPPVAASSQDILKQQSFYSSFAKKLREETSEEKQKPGSKGKGKGKGKKGKEDRNLGFQKPDYEERPHSWIVKGTPTTWRMAPGQRMGY